ncbi:hypothetical protein GGI11_000118 [Coemansia sp. RSA 2049]|nr:hypothetical protein GGI11_000118 [Coemansia sp. RSA 2049]
MRLLATGLLAVISAFGVFGGAGASEPNIIGYYASWKQAQTVGVDFSKYTHINLSFGVPGQDGSVTFDESLPLTTVIGEIHGNNTKALVSLGGWSDSTYFTKLVSDTTSQNPLVASIVNFVDTNNLDGIDLDWEYPGREGNGCTNPDLANDTPNYLKFVTNLRSAFTTKFGSGKKLITMAVRVQPFDVNSSPSTDVSGFAKSVDFINLMQYDINGAWMETTGPNAPLNFEKGKATQLSFASAIDAWTGAGWPASQINAGLAFYGRATTASEDMTKDPNNQYQAQEKGVLPQADKEDATWPDPCTGISTFSGVWQWKHLRDQGVLTETETAASPWVRTWDDTTMTPWLFNPSTKMFVSYDDPKSLTAKVDYAKSKGLAGSMVWAIYMDYNDELLDTVKSAWGSSSSSGTGAGAGSGVYPIEPDTSSADSQTDNQGKADTGDNFEDTTTTQDEDTTTQDDYTTTTQDNNNTATESPTDDGDTDTESAGNGGGSSGGSPADGEACTDDLAYKCGSDSGTLDYFVCLYGKWIKLSCAAGTVCKQQSSSIIMCDWPASSS